MLHVATRVSSCIGRIGEFSREKETFSAYVELMEMFFMTNNIVETVRSTWMQINASLNRREQFSLQKLVRMFTQR